jgi:hypothetical protein
MRLMRAIVLAIVVAMALAGGGGPTASARASTGPALVARADPFDTSTNVDPSDPGLPPD